MSVHKVSEKGFNAQVDVYSKARPSYTKSCSESLLKNVGVLSYDNEGEVVIDNDKKILEIGAGTGKFTEILVNYIKPENYVAVEPSEGMVDKFKEIFGSRNYDIIKSDATSLPFDDESIDVILMAQCFHWFANEDSLKEMHRVLKSNGKLGFIWNLPNEQIEWISNYRATFQQYEFENLPQYRKGLWKNVFDDQSLFSNPVPSKITFEDNITPCSVDMLWEKVLSRSYIASRGEEEQKMIKKDVLNSLGEFFDIEDENLIIDLQYLTDIYFCDKL
eukprot:TRINITY_DN1867_c0_g1_i1.p1 TRINITY_DN1867_c0_g1~~TRINITY_DN1867_c0_g1_i1.p1  ORF type:complete len:275 (+),score=83.44 TRINITY_DN1867_c0_g1_i1:194-1018(+)